MTRTLASQRRAHTFRRPSSEAVVLAAVREAPAVDDQQARKVRHLLLGKGAVSAHRIERPFAARLDESEQRPTRDPGLKDGCSSEHRASRLEPELALATDEQAPVLAILALLPIGCTQACSARTAAAGRTRVARFMAAGSRAALGDEAEAISRIATKRTEFALIEPLVLGA